MSYVYKTGRTELREQLSRHATLVKGRVLDVGAGNFSRYRDLFICDEYLKMDIGPGPNIDIVGQIEQIPFPDSSFDTIICTQVLGDVYNLALAFRELQRILRPHGRVLITESLFDPLHDEPNDFWRFTKHSLRRLAENTGLEVEILEPRGAYHSVMAQLRARYWIEKLGIHRRWFARPFSFGLKIFGELARWLDRRDHSQAGQIFTHGYLLVARKHA